MECCHYGEIDGSDAAVSEDRGERTGCEPWVCPVAESEDNKWLYEKTHSFPKLARDRLRADAMEGR